MGENSYTTPAIDTARSVYATNFKNVIWPTGIFPCCYFPDSLSNLEVSLLQLQNKIVAPWSFEYVQFLLLHLRSCQEHYICIEIHVKILMFNFSKTISSQAWDKIKSSSFDKRKPRPKSRVHYWKVAPVNSQPKNA